LLADAIPERLTDEQLIIKRYTNKAYLYYLRKRKYYFVDAFSESASHWNFHQPVTSTRLQTKTLAK